eukprot:Hpha_TRINITY_DN15315_c8_g8::TRINITY_DN15315_c8_g8_i1::g.91441::m.91441
MGTCSSSSTVADRGAATGRRKLSGPTSPPLTEQLVPIPKRAEEEDEFRTAVDSEEFSQHRMSEVAVVHVGANVITEGRAKRIHSGTRDQLADSVLSRSESMKLMPSKQIPPHEIKALDPALCTRIPPKPSKPKFIRAWDFLAHSTEVGHLAGGGVLFWFKSRVGNKLTQLERTCLSHVLNTSVFHDEEEENCVPHLDFSYRPMLSDHIFVLQKSCYLLPAPVTVDDLTVEILSSKDFRRATEPGKPKFHDVAAPDTYRMTKTIIWWVGYSITVQFRLSLVPDATLQRIVHHLTPGLPAHKAILFERTKSDKRKKDQLKKMKMLQLYHQLPQGGVLVTSIGGLCLNSIPKIVAPLVDQIGQLSGKDYADTCTNVRKELLRLREQREGS